MGKSLLSSFGNDFNATVLIKTLRVSTGKYGEKKKVFEIKHSHVKCLLLRDKRNDFVKPFDFTKTIYKARFDFGVDIKKGDLVINEETKTEYRVKNIEETPGFGGKNDHLLIYLETTS